MTTLQSALVRTFLLLSLAACFCAPSQTHAQFSLIDDVVKLLKNAPRRSGAIIGAGKAGSTALQVGKSARMGNARALLALRAKRAVINKSVSGTIAENNLPAWSELRTLGAIIDAEADAARLSMTTDDVAKATASGVTKRTTGHVAQPGKGKALQGAKQVPRRCEINLCEASALSGNRKLTGSCGPAEISGSQAGDFSFEFGIGPGSLSVSTGSSGTSVSGTAGLTDCVSMDFSQEIESSASGSSELTGAGCKPCGVGFNQLVKLFDAPALELMGASMDSGVTNPEEIENLIGDADDWQAVRDTIAVQNPNSDVGADLRGNHYLIEAIKLEHGEEISVLVDIWRRLGASSDRIAQEAAECAALYCPPNHEETKIIAKSRMAGSPPSWLRGSCSISALEGDTNKSDTIWFDIGASRTTVNLISDAFPKKGRSKDPMFDRMSSSCRHRILENEGTKFVRIQTEEISSNLTDLIDRFSTNTAFK